MPKNEKMMLASSLGLPQFETIDDLSVLVGVSTRLIYCLSMHQNRYYKEFTINKKDGTPRQLFAPYFSMLVIQKWILKNILDKILPSKYAMAFRRGSAFGCKENAKRHLDTLYGVALDLKNFFPTINAKRVYNVFYNMGYEGLSATILTNLCTLNGFLPQGSPCSPAISNLVCLSLDARLGGLCEKRNIHYTRYADDMYFSCDAQDVLKKSVPIIRKIIKEEGFIINEKKVRYVTPSNRKRITGITITRSKEPLNNRGFHGICFCIV